ncbi:motility associated factor glycosyltransferase family protein [Campylobacter troglodytis]|uniref:motility associated factor glycosyltransferase family protein n=1 Tax=Campylobacter troglodytis TaxID=654363 RepID=UPI001FE2FF6E|nr:motility associated factor glycosyltransferase family protein [Campylobacter troglodytis]
MIKTDNFARNLRALQGKAYAEMKTDLQKIKKLNFEYDFDKDESLNINIINKKTQERLYQKPYVELEKALEPFKKEYLRYPCLFFYGLGNGLLYKTLLQNKNHKRIVVFESNLEFIYMALNLIDFGRELFETRIIIIYNKYYNSISANQLFDVYNFRVFARLYTLHIHNDHYVKEESEIKRINDLNISAINTSAVRQGNDPRDALMGIEHFMINLPKMFVRPNLAELVKKRSKKTKFAILVATGPSLSKQLPLLKKYANKATIFCADSAYPILYKHKIKPDYVLCLERTENMADFFEEDFGEFDKDIVFVFMSLVHPRVVRNLEKYKRNYILIARTLPFALHLKLSNFGYVSGGMSVMNMAYELANRLLAYSKIIFIGQDLAYSEDGKSHAQNYLYKEREEVFDGKLKTITAYGGVGTVKTRPGWFWFKEFFENYINANKKWTKSYNCTEGGARIEGTIEIPFKQMCEEFLAKEADKKPFFKLKAPTRKQSGEDMLNTYKMIKKGQGLNARYIKDLKKILKQLQTVTIGKQSYTLDEINLAIDKIKTRMEHKKSLFCNEILHPPLSHQEAALAPLYAQNFENEQERQNKLVMWIFSHEAWLEEIIDLLEIFQESLNKNIVPLREELEKRRLL